MLTFKWKAISKNGKCVSQFEDSDLLPTQRENSFKLVQELEKENGLKRFELICVEDGLVHLAVDLETGHFNVRGSSFHPFNSLSIEDAIYRVVYFKRFRGHLGTRGEQIAKPYIYLYAIGWQCTFNDNNYQRIMLYYPATGGLEISGKC